MVDVNSVGGIFNFVFSFFDTSFLGSLAIMSLCLMIALIVLLFLMRAGRFVVVGFMAVLWIGLSSYGFAYVGWLAGLAFVIVGIMLAFIVMKLFSS